MPEGARSAGAGESALRALVRHCLPKGMSMQFGGALTSRRISARQHDHERNTARAYRIDDVPVAATDTLLRERELPVAVAGRHIHTRKIEGDMGFRALQNRRQMPLERIKVFGIAHTIP